MSSSSHGSGDSGRSNRAGRSGRVSVPPCVGDGMIVRRLVLRAPDVVFFKGVVEASEGLAAVFAEYGGDLTVASPAGRESELDAFLDELCVELDALRLGP